MWLPKLYVYEFKRIPLQSNIVCDLPFRGFLAAERREERYGAYDWLRHRLSLKLFPQVCELGSPSPSLRSWLKRNFSYTATKAQAAMNLKEH